MQFKGFVVCKQRMSIMPCSISAAASAPTYERKDFLVGMQTQDFLRTL